MDSYNRYSTWIRNMKCIDCSAIHANQEIQEETLAEVEGPLANAEGNESSSQEGTQNDYK